MLTKTVFFGFQRIAMYQKVEFLIFEKGGAQPLADHCCCPEEKTC